MNPPQYSDVLHITIYGSNFTFNMCDKTGQMADYIIAYNNVKHDQDDQVPFSCTVPVGSGSGPEVHAYCDCHSPCSEIRIYLAKRPSGSVTLCHVEAAV